MKIFNNIDHYVDEKTNTVLTIGTFDGVHIGHQKIIERLNQIKSTGKEESMILTFFPHPRRVLDLSNDIKMLTTLPEKTALLERFGLDNLIIEPFTKEFSRLSALEFVKDVLVHKLHVKKLVIGYDHQFGKNREGNFEQLQEYGQLYGFGVEEIPARTLSPDELAGEMLALQGDGAHNINLVSPTHVVAQVAEGLCIARKRGLSIPIVYNTNGYDAVETLRCLEGLIDVYLPDIKYSDDAVARTYSGIDRYVEVSRSAIVEMFRQVGNLSLDRDGIARRGILVRHLVLPEDLAGSEESLAFLASLSSEMVISLMAQYAPQYKAKTMPPLDRKISREEYERVLDWAWELGLERCFVQEVESSEALVPDFRRADPFGTTEG